MKIGITYQEAVRLRETVVKAATYIPKRVIRKVDTFLDDVQRVANEYREVMISSDEPTPKAIDRLAQ